MTTLLPAAAAGTDSIWLPSVSLRVVLADDDADDDAPVTQPRC